MLSWDYIIDNVVTSREDAQVRAACEYSLGPIKCRQRRGDAFAEVSRCARPIGHLHRLGQFQNSSIAFQYVAYFIEIGGESRGRMIRSEFIRRPLRHEHQALKVFGRCRVICAEFLISIRMPKIIPDPLVRYRK